MYTQLIQTDQVTTFECISPFADDETEIDFADEVRTFYTRIETLLVRDEWDGNRRARHDTGSVRPSILSNYLSSYSRLSTDPDLFFEVIKKAYLLNYAEYVFEITSKTRNLRLDIVWPDNPDLLDLGPRICPKGERLLRLGWLIKYHLELHNKQFPEFLSQKGYESPDAYLESFLEQLSMKINSARARFLYGEITDITLRQQHEELLEMILRGELSTHSE